MRSAGANTETPWSTVDYLSRSLKNQDVHSKICWLILDLLIRLSAPTITATHAQLSIKVTARLATPSTRSRASWTTAQRYLGAKYIVHWTVGSMSITVVLPTLQPSHTRQATSEALQGETSEPQWSTETWTRNYNLVIFSTRLLASWIQYYVFNLRWIPAPFTC